MNDAGLLPRGKFMKVCQPSCRVLIFTIAAFLSGFLFVSSPFAEPEEQDEVPSLILSDEAKSAYPDAKLELVFSTEDSHKIKFPKIHFGCSPDGRYVLFEIMTAERVLDEHPERQGLWLFDSKSNNRRALPGGNEILGLALHKRRNFKMNSNSFFFSPDSKKLVCVVLPLKESDLRIRIYNLADLEYSDSIPLPSHLQNPEYISPLNETTAALFFREPLPKPKQKVKNCSTNFAIYLLDIPSGKLQSVFVNQADYLTFYQHGENLLFYFNKNCHFSGRREQDLMVLSPDGACKQVSQTKVHKDVYFNAYELRISPDGSTFLRLGAIREGIFSNSNFFLMDAKTGEGEYIGDADSIYFWLNSGKKYFFNGRANIHDNIYVGDLKGNSKKFHLKSSVLIYPETGSQVFFTYDHMGKRKKRGLYMANVDGSDMFKLVGANKTRVYLLDGNASKDGKVFYLKSIRQYGLYGRDTKVEIWRLSIPEIKYQYLPGEEPLPVFDLKKLTGE